MFYTGIGASRLRDHKDKRFLSYSVEAKTEMVPRTGHVQEVIYGIEDKHCGNLDIKLTLQFEVEKHWDPLVVEQGLDIHLNNEKEKVDWRDNEDCKRSIKI